MLLRLGAALGLGIIVWFLWNTFSFTPEPESTEIQFTGGGGAGADVPGSAYLPDLCRHRSGRRDNTGNLSAMPGSWSGSGGSANDARDHGHAADL